MLENNTFNTNFIKKNKNTENGKFGACSAHRYIRTVHWTSLDAAINGRIHFALYTSCGKLVCWYNQL